MPKPDESRHPDRLHEPAHEDIGTTLNKDESEKQAESEKQVDVHHPAANKEPHDNKDAHYALRCWRGSGTWPTWPDYLIQYEGYCGTKGKKFDSTKAAEIYIQQQPLVADKCYFFPPVKIHNWVSTKHGVERLVVYTDGSCTSEGDCGFSVYWGPAHPWNRSENLGKQTSTRAEIEAAICATEQAIRYGVKFLLILTDLELLANYLAGPKPLFDLWQGREWKNHGGGTVENIEELKYLEMLSREVNIHIEKVPAHSGNVGNEEADKQAKAGARKFMRRIRPYPPTPIVRM